MSTESGLTEAIRRCATEVMGYANANGGDPNRARNEVIASIQRLLARPDLYAAGMPLPSRNQGINRLLYFDPKLMIMMGDFEKGRYDTPHDHGVWLATGVYRGEMEYADYRRVDDRTKPGYAKLELADHRVLKAGDVGLTPPPPHDIHENAGVTECYSILVCGGNLLPARHYFDPGKETCWDAPVDNPGITEAPLVRFGSRR